jgi:hypothetical protein
MHQSGAAVCQPLDNPCFKFSLNCFKLLQICKNPRKISTTPFLMNFMSMEILGDVEFNAIVYFPSFAIKSRSNLRLF